jgi:hypothetical protein
MAASGMTSQLPLCHVITSTRVFCLLWMVVSHTVATHEENDTAVAFLP